LNSQDYDSASEIDEDEKVDVKVTNVKEEVGATQQRAIKLSEIGPRLRLELVKIEEGMCDGKVLYHRYVNKTKREEKALEEKHRIKEEERARRRKEQEENVARRKAEKEAQSQKSKKKGVQNEAEEMDIDPVEEEEEEESDVDQEEMLLALENEMQE